MRAWFSDTHNVAEGAAGVALAGLLSQRAQLAGKKAGVIFCGGNIDRDLFVSILGAEPS
jgi:threonine dehydratase